MLSFDSDENIIEEVRRHWFVMFLPVVSSVILVFVPFILYGFLLFLPFDLSDFFQSERSLVPVFIVAYCLWLLAVVVFLTIQWTEYYLDVWYITNKRIVDVEQISLFSRKTKSLRLERIQDISVDVKGLLATLLGFGNVHVQTAGAARQIMIRQARRPYDVRRTIFKAADEKMDRLYPERRARFQSPATMPDGGSDDDSDDGSEDRDPSQTDGLS